MRQYKKKKKNKMLPITAEANSLNYNIKLKYHFFRIPLPAMCYSTYIHYKNLVFYVVYSYILKSQTE